VRDAYPNSGTVWDAAWAARRPDVIRRWRPPAGAQL